MVSCSPSSTCITAFASAAEEDAAFVAGLAAAHDLPFYLYRTDAPAAAATLHETLEEAARNLRYGFSGN